MMHAVVSENWITTESVDLQCVGMRTLGPISDRAPGFHTVKFGQ